MKINLAKYSGFCFGVKRAIDIARKMAKTKKNIVILGELVHNEDVVKKIEESGIKTIQRLKPGKGKTLIIRAHGTGSKTIRQARSFGYTIIDATCPMVKEIHTIAKNMEQKGYPIIVIGDKNHDEVKGIIGQLKKQALVIDEKKNMPLTSLRKINKAAIVVQSTQNIDKVLEIVSELKKQIKELKFFNTICNPTRQKQKEIKEMPLHNEVMLIIGSKTSANTKRLYILSKSINKKSYWIHSAKEINLNWLHGAENIGIAAGSSTPQETIKRVIEYIKNAPS